MSANTQFFSHDFNARNNYKLLELRAEFGWEGYGVFWAICESIAENDKPIPLDRIGALSISLSVSREFLARFFDYCIQLGLFLENEAGITSKSLEERLEYKREKARKAKESAEKRWKKANAKEPQCESNANAMQTHSERNANNTTQHNTTQHNISIADSDESKPPKKTAEQKYLERKQAFKKEVTEKGAEYADWMLEEFFGYWSEPSKTFKMRSEMEKTWDTNRRLQNWAKRAGKGNQSPYKVQVMDNGKKSNGSLKRIETLEFVLSKPDYAIKQGYDIELLKVEYKQLAGKEFAQ